MKKLLLTGVATLFLATGTAHARADVPWLNRQKFVACGVATIKRSDPSAVRVTAESLNRILVACRKYRDPNIQNRR